MDGYCQYPSFSCRVSGWDEGSSWGLLQEYDSIQLGTMDGFARISIRHWILSSRLSLCVFCAFSYEFYIYLQAWRNKCVFLFSTRRDTLSCNNRFLKKKIIIQQVHKVPKNKWYHFSHIFNISTSLTKSPKHPHSQWCVCVPGLHGGSAGAVRSTWGLAARD